MEGESNNEKEKPLCFPSARNNLKYYEMVMEALKHFNRPCGVSLSTIVQYIECVYHPDNDNICFLVERTLDWMIINDIVSQKSTGNYFFKCKGCREDCGKTGCNPSVFNNHRSNSVMKRRCYMPKRCSSQPCKRPSFPPCKRRCLPPCKRPCFPPPCKRPCFPPPCKRRCLPPPCKRRWIPPPCKRRSLPPCRRCWVPPCKRRCSTPRRKLNIYVKNRPRSYDCDEGCYEEDDFEDICDSNGIEDNLCEPIEDDYCESVDEDCCEEEDFVDECRLGTKRKNKNTTIVVNTCNPNDYKRKRKQKRKKVKVKPQIVFMKPPKAKKKRTKSNKYCIKVESNSSLSESSSSSSISVKSSNSSISVKSSSSSSSGASSSCS